MLLTDESLMCAMSVPFEVNFEQTNTVPRKKTLFRGIWRRGINWDSPPHSIAGFQPPTRPVLARSETSRPSPRRPDTESWVSGRRPARTEQEYGPRNRQAGPCGMTSVHDVAVAFK